MDVYHENKKKNCHFNGFVGGERWLIEIAHNSLSPLLSEKNILEKYCTRQKFEFIKFEVCPEEKKNVNNARRPN